MYGALRNSCCLRRTEKELLPAASNQLNSTLPASLSSLSNLTYVNLVYNRMTGGLLAHFAGTIILARFSTYSL